MTPTFSPVINFLLLLLSGYHAEIEMKSQVYYTTHSIDATNNSPCSEECKILTDWTEKSAYAPLSPFYKLRTEVQRDE